MPDVKILMIKILLIQDNNTRSEVYIERSSGYSLRVTIGLSSLA